MHHHAYLWTGPKSRFDHEALRRPPHPDPPPPTARPEVRQRHREVAAGFPLCDLPPLEPAYWLVKPASLVRGTWTEAAPAADWLTEQLRLHAPRFAREPPRDLTPSVTRRLASGGDVCLGFYLEHPSFLSLALITCSPNRAAPRLGCPLTPPPTPHGRPA
ncbi:MULTISPECIES: hypothetical protein [Streptomyces]|uniref:Uncharacterized protein n=1 Tax=Streptomyces doudnae TaxID=3075536 RepID=A0ABD5ETV5_9ACTN|nr:MULTISPECIES: hypothetical protein [unclassified Streptomyces]MDT0438128.1 hypothetical protein [Streptomyces sp. DSM 41981]MYQ65124.1 hypothetical protein [Streptomyces sp. SID4950]SCD93139.1 hypothetical protein GA0115242_117325 [Streptomyces sp. SolWspMP-5a-2]